jgi:hypothetical protein
MACDLVDGDGAAFAAFGLADLLHVLGFRGLLRRMGETGVTGALRQLEAFSSKRRLSTPARDACALLRCMVTSANTHD